MKLAATLAFATAVAAAPSPQIGLGKNAGGGGCDYGFVFARGSTEPAPLVCFTPNRYSEVMVSMSQRLTIVTGNPDRTSSTGCSSYTSARHPDFPSGICCQHRHQCLTSKDRRCLNQEGSGGFPKSIWLSCHCSRRILPRRRRHGPSSLEAA